MCLRQTAVSLPVVIPQIQTEASEAWTRRAVGGGERLLSGAGRAVRPAGMGQAARRGGAVPEEEGGGVPAAGPGH